MNNHNRIPYRRVRRTGKLKSLYRSFVEAPWAGGALLLLSVAVAMLLANIPATAEAYHRLLGTEVALRIGGSDGSFEWFFPRGMTVETFVNDCVMALFFLSVGLEIKREILYGSLSSPRRAALPVLAAAGGMLVPALIFLAFNAGTEAAAGWGIPTATDIAFAVGILAMMGDRVSPALKTFLLALAVADDLGAVLVIAIFYGGEVRLGLLAAAAVVLAFAWGLNRAGVRRGAAYLLPGAAVWALFYYSGVHATIAGVAMALVIPMRPQCSRELLVGRAGLLLRSLSRSEGSLQGRREQNDLRRLSGLAVDSMGLGYRLEHRLEPLVTFFIMPLFALANAGVHLSGDGGDIFGYDPVAGSVGLGVFLGLFAGKPLGIFLASWLAVRFGVAERPEGASWRMVLAVAALGGIGFTMSLFVDALAYEDPLFVDRGKIAILVGSAASALLGVALILLNTLNKKKPTKSES